MYKFVIDRMLCRLGRWLRIFGYDTRIINEELDDKFSKDDDELLLKIAEKEDRILITRDVDLYNKAVKNNLKSVYVEDSLIERQIFKLKQAIGIDTTLKMTRCTLCNGEVTAYTEDREDLLSIDYIPKKLLSDKKEELWVCKRCGQFYWIGKHWMMMKLMVEKVNKLV